MMGRQAEAPAFLRCAEQFSDQFTSSLACRSAFSAKDIGKTVDLFGAFWAGTRGPKGRVGPELPWQVDTLTALLTSRELLVVCCIGRMPLQRWPPFFVWAI